MFAKSQEFYDVVYSFKDYAKEAEDILTMIRRNSDCGETVLDIACGTGKHLEHLKTSFKCFGLDVDPGLVEIAQKRNPECEIFLDDMVTFDVKRRFGVALCLFSSIGYAETPARLEATISRVAAHIEPGGLFIVEPWLHPDKYSTGRLDADFIEEANLKITRMNTTEREANVSVILFHYLVGQGTEISYFIEEHKLGLFTDAEYRSALANGGFRIAEHTTEFSDRGHYICVKSE
jgi:SAM-dependent methyltransferase